MMRRSPIPACALLVAALVGLLGLGTGAAQEPLDLFRDHPALAPGYIRVCAWNLRHLNLEEHARAFLPGGPPTPRTLAC